MTIDKTGNLYPCPQVAVSPYGHLAYGNLRSGSLTSLLQSHERRQSFERDVTRDMRCRICDRKDEAINYRLERLAYQATPVQASGRPGG